MVIGTSESVPPVEAGKVGVTRDQGSRLSPDHSATATATRFSLLDAKAAASGLGISSRKLWELTNCGAISHVRIGRRVLYDPRDLDRFIEKAKRGGA